MNAAHNVSRETATRLERYVGLLLAENQHQNLISKSTEGSVWTRHIDDSAQLIDLAPNAKSWVDIGSGAGLPGIVVAIQTDAQVKLVEPRRLRVDFLERVAADLELANVSCHLGKAQSAIGHYDVITARAVANTAALFEMTRHLCHRQTKYLLMKGRGAQSELDEARRTWQGDFTLVPSRTDPEASIIVASNVTRGGK